MSCFWKERFLKQNLCVCNIFWPECLTLIRYRNPTPFSVGPPYYFYRICCMNPLLSPTGEIVSQMAPQRCNVNFSARFLGWIFWCEFWEVNFSRVDFSGGLFCWSKKKSQKFRPKNSGPKFGRPKFVSQNSALDSGSGGSKSSVQTFVPHRKIGGNRWRKTVALNRCMLDSLSSCTICHENITQLIRKTSNRVKVIKNNSTRAGVLGG